MFTSLIMEGKPDRQPDISDFVKKGSEEPKKLPNMDPSGL